MGALSADKVRVFVSSTLKESLEERTVVKAAIASLNLAPVMFEEAGARSYPPREWYMRSIAESAIFVGIYRESYGWIVLGGVMSGLEDEYRLASGRGLFRHIYVLSNPGAREPRLGALMDEMKASGNVVVFSYHAPADLYERVRDDLTATLSEGFLAASSSEYSEESAPSDAIKGLFPNPTERLPRAQATVDVLGRLSHNGCAVVAGPMGIGKTVLLAGIAADNGWPYVDARGKSLKQVYDQLVRTLRRARQRSAIAFSGVEEARRVFASEWSEWSGGTFVVDGLDDCEPLLSACAEGRGFTSGKRLLTSARDSTGVPPQWLHVLAPLDINETAALVTSIRGTAPSPSELSELVTKSSGNPLYVRYYAGGRSGDFESEIVGYEVREWRALAGDSREALTYLVLCGRAMAIAELMRICKRPMGSVELFLSSLSSARHLLKVSLHGIDIFHDHFRQTALALITNDTVRHQYYATALGEELYKGGDSVAAFLVFDRAQLPRAGMIVNEAAFATVWRGEITQGLRVIQRQLELAESSGDVRTKIQALGTLAQIHELAGRPKEAAEAFQLAETTARAANDQVATRLIRERRLAFLTQSEHDPNALQELVEIEADYRRSGKVFEAGRVGVDISAAYIRTERYRDAAKYAEQALKDLSAANDEYGAGLARGNLAAALAALPGEGTRSQELLAQLSDSPSGDESPRLRALVCNVLSRHYRRDGNFAKAREYAAEAIDIGERLGDLRLVAVNSVNLANNLLEEGRVDEALAAYGRSSQIAAQAQFIDVEAHANELIASTLNGRGDYTQALEYATYAAATARRTLSRYRLAACLEEQATSFAGLSRTREAGVAYLDGAELLATMPENSRYFVKLFMNGIDVLSEANEVVLLAERLGRILTRESIQDGSVGPREQLLGYLQEAPRVLPLDRFSPVFGTLLKLGFERLPPAFARGVIDKLVGKLLLGISHGNPTHATLMGLGTLFAALPVREVSLEEIVTLAEEIASTVGGLSFKPASDGAMHWTVRLEFSQAVLCTITQLDDRIDTALVATILALWLKGLEREIRERILMVSELPRREVAINVINMGELAANVDLSAAGLDSSLVGPCAVTRATDQASSLPPPLVVVCRDDMAEDWLPGASRPVSLLVLCGQILTELAFHLLKGSVDQEVLRSNVISVVKEVVA